MAKRIPDLSIAMSIAALSILSACAAGQLPVVEKLDELTSVTITYSRTPIIMSPDTPYDREVARDFVQIGALEVNRMGARQYFLWLGISDMEHMASTDTRPEAFESIVLVLDDENFRFDVGGWTPAAIGASEPVYKKIFPDSEDAYYPVTLDHIRLLAAADVVKLRTSGSASKEFIPWYKQTTAKNDLAEFVRTVLQ